MLEDRKGHKYTNYADMVPIRSEFCKTALLTRHPVRLNSAYSLGMVKLICTKYWYYKHRSIDKNKHYKSCRYFFPFYIKHLLFKCPFFPERSILSFLYHSMSSNITNPIIRFLNCKSVYVPVRYTKNYFEFHWTPRRISPVNLL